METTHAERRSTALAVLKRLREAGHESYLVGGCVRDELLGREPAEYDVATSAVPDEVEELFERTVAVGKQFGVMIALLDHVPTEVATFRTEGGYQDGRRPTHVEFASAREDASRRDFTVNGLFLDPDSGEILDFVGGRADLDARVLRAIGDAEERFADDKLRLLRAVRFASTIPLEIEPATWRAVKLHASDITQVAWERIRQELSRILVSGRAEHGFDMLHRSGLLAAVLPEMAATEGVEQPPEFHPEGDVWVHTLLALQHVDALAERPLQLALAALLHDVGKPPTFVVAERIRFDGHDRVGADMAREILLRLRYPTATIDEVVELVRRHMAFVQIREWRVAKLRRFLTGELAGRHLALHRVDCLAAHGDLGTYDWCNDRRAEFLAEPPPPVKLLSGHDLLTAGYAKGPAIGRVLAAVDDESLEGRVTSQEEALAWALEHLPPPEGQP